MYFDFRCYSHIARISVSFFNEFHWKLIKYFEEKNFNCLNRLSLQLKIYEPIKKENIEMANHFLNVHKWINENVRNILDESDAILQPNYQLIYTVGNQSPPDGGSQR